MSENNNYDSRIQKLEDELSELKILLNQLVDKIPEAKKVVTDKPSPPLQSQQQAFDSPLPPPPPSSSPQKPAPVQQQAPATELSKQYQRPIKPEPSKSFEIPEHMKSGEYWLNKIGIGLVIFAVLFFFKYSIDQGWLVPKIRIALGLALGLILQVFAFRVYNQKKHFSLVLFGGGIAVFYICGFAAFQMFSLVSHQTAFFFMLAVTLYSISLSIKQNEQVLSLIGLLGAFATPFLLYTGEGNLPGLMMYISVIIAGTAFIYFFKSWRGVLWTAYTFGLFIALLGVVDLLNNSDGRTDIEKMSVQLALIICWLSFAIIPLLREIFAQIKPEKYSYIQFNNLKKLLSEQFERQAAKHAYILFVTTPVVVFTASTFIWPEDIMSQKTWGWIAMAVAMFYWFTAIQLQRWKELKTVSAIKLLVGILFITISFFLLLEGKTLMAVLGAEAFTLFYLGTRFTDNKFLTSSYILFTIVFFGTATRLMWNFNSSESFFSLDTLTDLWIIGLTFTAFYLSKVTIVKRIFYPVAIILLTALFDREFSGNTFFLLITLIMLSMHLIQKYLKDTVLTTYAQIYLGAISIWMIDRLMLTEIILFPKDIGHRPLLNVTSGVDILFLGSLIYSSSLLKTISEKKIYYLWAHIVVLSIFLRDFQSLENGQGYVTIAWGLYAALLLIAGLRLNKVALRKVSLVTLLIVVAKLFLIDLSNLETIWRILLFLGFGGVFLLLSYYFKSLWKDSDEKPDSEI